MYMYCVKNLSCLCSRFLTQASKTLRIFQVIGVSLLFMIALDHMCVYDNEMAQDGGWMSERPTM